jgi:hypothetical protein
MAKDPPPSLIFNASSFGIPTKGASRCESIPSPRRLKQTHGEPRHHDLGPWQMLPWRYEAKPLGVGRQRLILFLCVVMCVSVCAMFCTCQFFRLVSGRIFC